MNIFLLALFLAIGVLLFFRGWSMAPRQDLLETRLAQFRDQTVTLEEIELQQPFSERFLRPFLERLGAFLNSRVGRDRISVIQNKLALAGRPGNLTVNGFISVKLVAGVVVGFLGFGLVTFANLQLPAMGPFLSHIVLAVVIGCGG